MVNTYRETEVSLQNFEAILAMPPEPRPQNPIPVTDLDTLEFKDVGFQHQSAKRRMFFHRPNNCPRNHHGRRGGLFSILLFSRVTLFTNRVPTRVDLQICRNHARQLSRDGW